MPARQEEYRREGESVLIVRGRLRTGPWLCDRCNATLDSGSAAWLASFLPAWITGQTEAYEFEYERAYFAMNEATVAVYGAAWPAITLTPAGKVAHRPGRPGETTPVAGTPVRPGSVRRGAGVRRVTASRGTLRNSPLRNPLPCGKTYSIMIR